MNLNEFRIAHSTVMEHYQFIERELEGIYAALSGKRFYAGLIDVEKFSINKIIRMIQEQEKIHGKIVISDAEYEDLKYICQRRNFWTHNCYTTMVFDRKTEGPKKETDIKQFFGNYFYFTGEEGCQILYHLMAKLYLMMILLKCQMAGRMYL